jgi:hypothetical protein
MPDTHPQFIIFVKLFLGVGFHVSVTDHLNLSTMQSLANAQPGKKKCTQEGLFQT